MKMRMEQLVEIPVGPVKMTGILAVPESAEGIVLFAHGSGSGRLSPRNQFVARALRDNGLGTLLIDLLDEREADDRRKVFDIDLLAERLLAATDWLMRDERTKDLRIGYFGASTGAAAALQAAAKKGPIIGAVVSRGGRPDLAMNYLQDAKSPTLLLVGGDDYPVIPLNQQAFEMLPGPKEMVIVPGASHLFEKPGKLEIVADHAQRWFNRYLTAQEEA